MRTLRFLAICSGRLDRERVPRAAIAWLAGGCLAAAVLCASSTSDRSWAGTQIEPIAVVPARVSRQAVSLRDRLVVGLQARLRPEVEFVEVVAARVRTGHLPQRLVDETFFWARQRATDGRTGRTRRPIIFFQPAMSARARRLNVEL